MLRHEEVRSEAERFNCRLYVTFIDKDGESHKLAVAKGDNLLDIAQFHDLEMEGSSRIGF